MISDDEIDAFLAHHGVKGQKWGIRNLKKKHDASAAARRAKSGGPQKGFHRDGTLSTSEKAALIASGGAAAFLILQRIGLHILL